jgi:mRNA-degrading endonuclease toxin of MazEF toxin-antitoxin module
MRRGDVVSIAAAGDYGKPRPAVIVQTDAFPASHASVVDDLRKVVQCVTIYTLG